MARGPAIKDMTGQRYGRLTVISQAEKSAPTPSNRSGLIQWLCHCDCGAEVIRPGIYLRTGHTSSCGCLQRETAAASLTVTATTHGFGKHELYGTWWQMMQRCTNPDHKNFDRYGGRGIKVHLEWQNADVFIAQIVDLIGERQDGYSLDRINNDGNYEPGNVRWATQSEQVRNGRWKDRFDGRAAK